MHKILSMLLILSLSVALQAAVAKSDSGTAVVVNGASVTTVDLTTFTVSAGSNLCLVAFLQTADAVTATSVNWDSAGTPQGMTSRGSQVNGGNRVEAFVLVNPTTGNKTLTASWTTGSHVSLGAIAFSGANQTTCINTADTATNTGNGNTASQTVTSSTDGATAAAAAEFFNTISTSTQTEIWIENTFGTGGTYALAGTSNQHDWTIAGAPGNWVTVGVHVIAAASGGTGYTTTRGIVRP